jgi:hypothetical protein
MRRSMRRSMSMRRRTGLKGLDPVVGGARNGAIAVRLNGDDE